MMYAFLMMGMTLLGGIVRLTQALRLSERHGIIKGNTGTPSEHLASTLA